MAGASLLLLLDDIASVLDDVALLTKVAGKKTAGVLGDDIALNAQQVAGVVSQRELPVVWAVAKGSFVNKLILVPAALAISAFLPSAIIPLLMLGGVYLCYEGVEKLAHSLLHRESRARLDAVPEGRHGASAAMPTPEQSKIKGAIRTDFILSAEIVAITLGTVATATLMTQSLVVSSVAVIMTVGVYGLVAGIVKLDDAGLHLSQQKGDGSMARILRGLGGGILSIAPYLMKGLSIAGTAAMFLVGGGILTHGVPGAEALAHRWAGEGPAEIDAAGLMNTTIEFVGPLLFDAAIGIAAGALALGAVTLTRRLLRGATPS